MKILIFAKHVDGGTGTFLHQLFYLESFKHKTITVQASVLQKPDFRDAAFNSNRISYFDSANRHPLFYKFDFLLIKSLIAEYSWLRKQLMSQNPDVVLSVDTHCNILASLVKLFGFRHIKLVATVHNNLTAVTETKLSPFLRYVLKKVGHILLQFADEIVTVSKGIANDTQQFFELSKPAKVIPYGIDLKQVKQLSQFPLKTTEKKLFSANRIRIISVGRLAPQKDFVTLINSFAKIHRHLKNCEFIILGDGENKHSIQSLIKKLNLGQKVHLLGWKKNIYPYLKKSDVFILASHYEGFGYVLIEAMAMGLPVISTNSPFGPEEILAKGKYGIVVPVENTALLSKHMLKLIKNKHLRKKYALKSRKRVNYYSERNMLFAYHNLFYSLNTAGRIQEN